MISIFQILVLATCGWAGMRLWNGTTSGSARIITVGSVAYLAWSLVSP
jgi:hypothetical protein